MWRWRRLGCLGHLQRTAGVLGTEGKQMLRVGHQGEPGNDMLYLVWRERPNARNTAHVIVQHGNQGTDLRIHETEGVELGDQMTHRTDRFLCHFGATVRETFRQLLLSALGNFRQ